MTQSIQENGGRLPAIETEGHLIQVGREMLCADLVPSSHNAALQEGECGLDRVGMNVALHVYPVTMADSLMLGTVNACGNHGLGISRKLIRDHHINIST